MTDMREALKAALGHIEHMSAWITETNKKAKWSNEIYSFESLGEDMPGMRAALAPGEPVAWRGQAPRTTYWVSTTVKERADWWKNNLHYTVEPLYASPRALDVEEVAAILYRRFIVPMCVEFDDLSAEAKTPWLEHAAALAKGSK